MSGTIFGIAGGTIGAILGATIAWLSSRRHAQALTLFEMHREWHAEPMVKARGLAGRIANAHPDADFVALRRMLEPEKMQLIWSVVYFFERLWMAVKHRYVKPRLVPELFGASFYWWYTSFFERRLVPLDDPTAHHIRDLNDWFQRKSSAKEKDEWVAYFKTWDTTGQPQTISEGEKSRLSPKGSAVPN